MPEPTPAAIDERAIRAYRLQRLRDHLAKADVAGILLTDPTNLRYATGSRNMQVWTMHNVCRYAFVATSGPVVLFDLPSSMHLSTDLETIDERRPSLAWDYMAVGERGAEMAGRWAREIADLVRIHGGGNRRLALDRADLLPLAALAETEVVALDGKGIMERTRAVKSPEEVRAFVASLRTTEAAIGELKAALAPGHERAGGARRAARRCIRRGGEYPETRLSDLGAAHQPLVPGNLRPDHGQGRAALLRHRHDRPHGLLHRSLAELPGGRRPAERCPAPALRSGAPPARP